MNLKEELKRINDHLYSITPKELQSQLIECGLEAIGDREDIAYSWCIDSIRYNSTIKRITKDVESLDTIIEKSGYMNGVRSGLKKALDYLKESV